MFAFPHCSQRYQQCILCFLISSCSALAFSFTMVPWCRNNPMQNHSFLKKWPISGQLDRPQPVIVVPSILTRTGRWFTHGDREREKWNARCSRLPQAALADIVDIVIIFFFSSNSFLLLGFTIGHSEQAWAPLKGRRGKVGNEGQWRGWPTLCLPGI